MAMSYKQNTTRKVRSISFPPPLHPTTYRMEKELNDIKTCLLSSSWSTSCKPNTEAVCEGLLKLSPLYEGIMELIKSLSFVQNEKWVEEPMDGLVGFLDVCGIMRNLVSELKGHVVVLQCALRSRKGVSIVEKSIGQFNGVRKRIRKDVKRLIASVKIPMAVTLEDHHHHHHDHELLIKRVKEVREVTVIIFESLLNLLDSRTPVANKWPIVVSKLIKKTRVTCEEQHRRQQQEHCGTIFDLEVLGVMSPIRYIKDGLSSWSYNKYQLETVEAQLERIEDNLESIYMTLIRTRASLLNIVSHY
ncbi:hypothetical protein LXL04_007363 [Taraxacum kok-saghyz]